MNENTAAPPPQPDDKPTEVLPDPAGTTTEPGPGTEPTLPPAPAPASPQQEAAAARQADSQPTTAQVRAGAPGGGPAPGSGGQPAMSIPAGGPPGGYGPPAYGAAPYGPPAYGSPAYGSAAYGPYGSAGSPPPGGYPPAGTYPPPAPTPPPPGSYPPPKRLMRSRTDRVIGGVCGGLARYWNTDPTLLRILTVVLTLATGGAFLIGYLIAWIAIPDEPLGPPSQPAAPGGDQVGYAAGGNPAYGEPPVAVTEAPRERSYLGWLVISVVLLVAGVLALIAVFAQPTIAFWGVLFATILTLLGVGLLIGSRYGRARWLVILAVPMAFVTLATVAAGNWVQDNPDWGRWSEDGRSLSIGERTWEVTPAMSADSPLEYRLSAGDALLDLTALTRDPGASAEDQRFLSIEAGVGLGQLVVLVPRDMTLELDARVDIGQITVIPDGSPIEGANLELDTTIEPLAEEASWVVTLDAAIGAGNLEVRRATA